MGLVSQGEVIIFRIHVYYVFFLEITLRRPQWYPWRVRRHQGTFNVNYFKEKNACTEA